MAKFLCKNDGGFVMKMVETKVSALATYTFEFTEDEVKFLGDFFGGTTVKHATEITNMSAKRYKGKNHSVLYNSIFGVLDKTFPGYGRFGDNG